MEKKILRIIMILMLVLMGSVSAVAQGFKIKRFSYAKSGETLRGEQLYARTDDVLSWERKNGYSPYPWILYLENGGTVQLELPDGQKHQVGPGMHKFTYHNGEKMFIHVNVVPYAVPYLGELRLRGAVSDRSLKRLTSPDPEGNEEFYQYTINSDNDLKLLTMNTSPGPVYLLMTQSIPTQGYWYSETLASHVDFAKGVSVDQLKQIAVSQGLDPQDFVVQVGIYGGDILIYSDIYRDRAKIVDRLTWIRIIDKRQKYYTLKASSNDEALGTVEPATLTVKAGGEATFTAKAKENAIFKGWKKGTGEVTVTESVLKLTNVQEASEWTAVFEKKAEEKYYTLKASSNDPALGTVNPAELKVKAGGEASFTAKAKENAIFKGWKEKGTGKERDTPVLHLTDITNSSEWIAIFEKKAEEKCTLTVKVSPEHVGKVLLDGKDQSSVTVKKGTRVRLKAEVVHQNYEFRGWKTAAQVSLGKQTPFDYLVAETETVIAVFEKKASAPQVGPVEINFGQREAILTWASSSATSWQIKLYQADQILGDPIVTQVPRVELGNLSPGQEYRYEIIAIAQGKLDSEAKKATFMTENFNEADAITPYLKGFSQFRGGQAFDLIWMDVNPTEFVSETPIYRYYWQATPTSELVPLTPSGKQLTLDENRRGGRLIVRILSGNDQLYEIGYDLNQ